MMDTFVLKGKLMERMTDDEFLRFAFDNQELKIERNSKLEILIMSPVSTLSAYYSSKIYTQLTLWNEKHQNGITFDSSVGFTLPDRSILSPDASWVSNEKWSKLSKADLNRFAYLCPEFVIEVGSKTDDADALKRKMQTWISNGALLAWFIDPINKMSYIYRPAKPEEIVKGFDLKLKGEGPVSGFDLDLSILDKHIPK
ncbi:Uma2 family endonuclease [Chryseolinea lacunae]|uniref:Uma2 family endonuclease n=1 Tax=Chryseolinea lacunae TaxID=2801331 RepID=A0ABS1L152_9BACT|nr:Uma2 family endonuclease [Chryseolinea lacunae]MBL0745183.1 Uma2 family endonuclease [Chryseolinea lacunae]